MADDDKKDDENKDEGKATIEVSVSEYNDLKSKVQGLQTLQLSLTDKEKEIARLNKTITDVKAKQPNRDEIEKELRTEFATQIESLTNEKSTLAARLKSMTVTDKVMSAIGDSLIVEARKFVRQDIEAECDLEGDIEAGKIVIKGEDGKVRWSDKKKNEHMSVEEYVDTLKTRYPSFFVSNAKNGEPPSGGTKGAAPSPKAKDYTMADAARMTDEQLSALSPEERRSILRGLKG